MQCSRGLAAAIERSADAQREGVVPWEAAGHRQDLAADVFGLEPTVFLVGQVLLVRVVLPRVRRFGHLGVSLHELGARASRPVVSLRSDARLAIAKVRELTTFARLSTRESRS
jgi:hypothetical protein